MKYNGKSVEIIGSKTLFGKDTVWIHILEDNTFVQVLRSDLEDDITDDKKIGMSYVRYVAIAARIKEEMAQKRLLAPYESSLIPLPHQILVLENGSIVGKGTHEELLHNCTVYQQIAKSQLSAEELGLSESDTEKGAMNDGE